MIRVGICDDNEKDRQRIYTLCEKYFEEDKIEHEYFFFTSGEEVLGYCEKEKGRRIDLLFLDVEMEGISGIKVKDRVLREDMIWRIVFVSSYKEEVYNSFGLKTIGFEVKPISKERVNKWIRVVLEDMKADVLLNFKDISGAEHYVRMEDIEYFAADGNCTRVFLHNCTGRENKSLLIFKKIGELEKELAQYPIIRVHKSYMVNLENVMDIRDEVSLRDMQQKVPVGRTYKESSICKYREYGRNKMRKRL